MPKLIPNRRQDERQPFPKVLCAAIEFDSTEGERHRLPLTGVSADGASFEVPRRIPGVEVDAVLTDAVISVADFDVQGNLTTRHTTREFGSKYTCGVRFFPKTENDRNQLVCLVWRLGELPRV